MKKQTIIILIVGIILLTIGAYFFIQTNNNATTITDAEKFASEYKEVEKNNVFVYRTAEEIIQIMKHGTGVVYLGYPECPWCQAYVKYLNEVAIDVGIDKIYYCNTKKVKEENMEQYNQLVELLHGTLEYNDEGKEWIYVPNVSFHIEGKIIGTDHETAKDTHNLKDPKEYWTEEEVTDLKTRLKNDMKPVFQALSMCTDCNK